jgi:hypothetical protein
MFNKYKIRQIIFICHLSSVKCFLQALPNAQSLIEV